MGEHEKIEAVAASLTKPQRIIAEYCGDVLDRFPCGLCGATTPKHCGVSQENRVQASAAAREVGGAFILRSYLQEQA